MSRRRRLAAIYGRIWRTYRGWLPLDSALAVIVFIPLGLVDSLGLQVDLARSTSPAASKSPRSCSRSGAVTDDRPARRGLLQRRDRRLAHPPPGRGRRPRCARSPGDCNYGRLIAVDLLFVADRRRRTAARGRPRRPRLRLARPLPARWSRSKAGAVCGGLRRSFELVRGNFWLVFCGPRPDRDRRRRARRRAGERSPTACSATPSSPPGWPRRSPTSSSRPSSRSPPCCSRSS